MSLEVYNNIDIMFYSAIILLILITDTVLRNEVASRCSIYRTLIAITILIILVIDIIARSNLNLNLETQHNVKYFLNFTYLILQPVPVSFGLMFIFSLFHEKKFTLKQNLLFLIPTFVGITVMICSIFTGFIFYIDENSIYQRGPGMFIFGIINYSYIPPAIGLIIYHRDKIKRQTITIIIIFTLIPLLGSLAQLLQYGLITAWPSFTLALLLIYFFQENRNSDMDYLTGLLNRRSFDIKMYNRIDLYSKKGSFALIVADLDKFKSINDNFGHDVGDKVIQVAGSILSRSISVTDSVARYGGDEFVMILESDNPKLIKKVLARIELNIDNWNLKNNNDYNLSMSCGYSIYNPSAHKGYKELFKEADDMMFESKKLQHSF